MTPDSARSTTTAEITWEDLLRVLEERPDWLARVRQVVLTPDLLSLPEAIQDLIEVQHQTTLQIRELVEAQRQHEARLTRLEATVQELVEAQRETSAQIRELVEAQRRHEARLTRLEATVQELVEAQRQTTLQIQELGRPSARPTSRFRNCGRSSASTRRA